MKSLLHARSTAVLMASMHTSSRAETGRRPDPQDRPRHGLSKVFIVVVATLLGVASRTGALQGTVLLKRIANTEQSRALYGRKNVAVRRTLCSLQLFSNISQDGTTYDGACFSFSILQSLSLTSDQGLCHSAQEWLSVAAVLRADQHRDPRADFHCLL